MGTCSFVTIIQQTKPMKRILILSILLCTVIFAFGQKTMDEGFVKYEIVEVSSEDESMNAQLQMMKGSTMDVYFTKGKQKINMDMLGGMMKMQTILDKEGAGMIMLMDMMGRKIMVEGDKDQFEAMNEAQKQDSVDFDISYDKSDVKEIAGYSCYKATIIPKGEGAHNVQVEAYITDDIKASNDIIKEIKSAN